jgi:hypothetical protein
LRLDTGACHQGVTLGISNEIFFTQDDFVSIKDVALQAGVSMSTVWLALAEEQRLAGIGRGPFDVE